MRRIATLIASLALTGSVVLAHGGNEHVRGVVTVVTPQSITVQTGDKATRTLTVSSKTEVKQSGKTVRFDAVQVGARVVIDVPEKTTEASLIQIGTSAPTTAKK